MAKQISLPLAEGYSALVLTNTQLDALHRLLNMRDVYKLVCGYDKQVIARVQAKIDEQLGSEPLV